MIYICSVKTVKIRKTKKKSNMKNEKKIREFNTNDEFNSKLSRLFNGLVNDFSITDCRAYLRILMDNFLLTKEENQLGDKLFVYDFFRTMDGFLEEASELMIVPKKD